MSLEIPELPVEWNWSRLREVLLDWFYKYQNAQNTVPAGTIAAFIGTTAPDGWLKCDGTEYPQEKFPDLYKVIGTESSAGNFRVPTATAASPVSTAGLTATMRSQNSDTTDAISYSWSAQALGPEVDDRLIVVCFLGRENSATSGLTVSSATVGGVTLTKIVEVETTNEGNPNTNLTIMAAYVPTGTTGNVAVTWNLSCRRCAFMLYDIPGASNVAFDTATARHSNLMAVNIDVASGGAVIGITSTDVAGCAWSGITEDYEALIEVFSAYSSAHGSNMAAETNRAVSANWATATISQGLAVASFQKLVAGEAIWMIKV